MEQNRTERTERISDRVRGIKVLASIRMLFARNGVTIRRYITPSSARITNVMQMKMYVCKNVRIKRTYDQANNSFRDGKQVPFVT